jgi:hypothetical protein
MNQEAGRGHTKILPPDENLTQSLPLVINR